LESFESTSGGLMTKVVDAVWVWASIEDSLSSSAKAFRGDSDD
jgi:hypothetical protein